MGEDILNYANKESLALKEVRKYIKKNKEEIVDKGIKHILINDKYTTELNKKLEKFKKSITKGHFKWIIADTKNPSKVDFNNIYKKNMETSLYEAYCDFYTYLLSSIDKIESFNKMQKDALSDYYEFLKEQNCH
jgi:hypothetical protein